MTSPSAPIALPEAKTLDQAEVAVRAVRVPWLLCVGLAAIPALAAVVVLGRVHPDEVYQFLEPAFFRVHGFGVRAWEWRVGLRNWGFPLAIAAMLKVAGFLGLTDPRAYRVVVELPQWALNVWALAATFRYADRRVGRTGALWSLALVALIGTVCIYAGRTLGESLSAAFLVIGLEALDREGAGLGDGAVGGFALGMAVVARYGSAIFVLVALVWLLSTKRYRALWGCIGVGGAVALGLGALDWATWGGPFHSLIAYLNFNVLSKQAAERFGSMSPTVYLLPLVSQMPLWVVPGLGLSLWRERPRVSLAGVSGVVYVTALFFTLHKEDRFLYPGMVVVALAAAPHVVGWALERQTRLLRFGALGLALAASVATVFFGPDLRGDEFRAIVQASRGAHGLLIVNEGVWGAGGFFYVGQNIPWWTCDQPGDPAFRAAVTDSRFDRAVTYDARALTELQAHGFQIVDRIGHETVLAR